MPIILLVKHPHRKSSARGSVAQRVDEDIQGGESPYHLVVTSLNVTLCFADSLPSTELDNCSRNLIPHICLLAPLRIGRYSMWGWGAEPVMVR